jgi:hypothetical protein
MEQENNILKHLRKGALPSVPENFFDDFSESLLTLIDLQNESDNILDNLKIKQFKNDFKSNENIDYKGFIDFDDEADVVKLKPRKTKQILLWTVAIAACFVLFFTLPFNQNNQTDLTDDLVNEEMLLAYLDEEDLVDYIIENETAFMIDSSDFFDEIIFDELSDGILDYLNDL